ncbi:hypothetical protein HY522_00925 [bacterium]|nr:hypothetical protein [bacterium]
MSLEFYRGHLLDQAPLLLSHLDREPFSPTLGSFDRLHWGWSAIDISNADFQKFALPLAYLYLRDFPGNPYHRHTRLLEWIESSMLFLCADQNRSGGFDQWLPNDNSIVSAGFVFHDIIPAADLLKEVLDRGVRSKLEEAAGRAARLLARHEEKHGFNSNHQLANAAALYDIHSWTGDAACLDRAREIVRGVLKRQAKSGALFEYAGADPGYHTLGTAFLAACMERDTDFAWHKEFRAAVEFSSFFMSGVTGSGGCYGSRGTKLLYPSGFILGAGRGVRPDLPAKVEDIIRRGLCVTPRNTDLTNLIPLLSDYTRACLVLENHPQKADRMDGPPTGDLFCGETTMFSLKRGACRLRGRLSGGMIEIESEVSRALVFSSAGYLVRTDRGNAFTGVLDGRWSREGGVMTFEGEAQLTNRIRQRPFLYLCLRILFVSVGNWMPANLLIKRILGWLLIFKKQGGGVDFHRRLEVGESRAVITDRFKNNRSAPVRIRHCREGYMNFMGSSRYFDLSLLATPSHNPDDRDEKSLKPGETLEVTYSLPLS